MLRPCAIHAGARLESARARALCSHAEYTGWNYLECFQCLKGVIFIPRHINARTLFPVLASHCAFFICALPSVLRSILEFRSTLFRGTFCWCLLHIRARIVRLRSSCFSRRGSGGSGWGRVCPGFVGLGRRTVGGGCCMHSNAGGMCVCARGSFDAHALRSRYCSGGGSATQALMFSHAGQKNLSKRARQRH